MLSVGLCTVHRFLFNANLTYIIMIHRKKTLYYNVKKNEDNPSKETSSFIYLFIFFIKSIYSKSHLHSLNCILDQGQFFFLIYFYFYFYF